MLNAAALIALAALAACTGARPILPRRPPPQGTFQARFTRGIRGPLELTIDGARIPVEQRGRSGRTLTVSGLSEGTHRYFFYCPAEVMGPDKGEFEIGPGAGVFQVHFSQKLRVAYAEAPGARGLAPAPAHGGVTAVLE
jgi:hypothetical protein